jgi:hypothetical protein
MHLMRKSGLRLSLVAALCAAFAVGTAGVSSARTARPATFGATVTVDTAAKTIGGISGHFIGLSFESGTLNSGKFDNVGDLARLLKNLGSSVMRFGGTSVDESAYKGATAKTLAGLARLAKASGWTVLYSENLGTFSAKTAGAVTADAKRVSAALGSRLSAIACGNEPELFVRNGYRKAPYTEADFLKQDASCLAAVRAGAPKVTLAGPDTYVMRWLQGYKPSPADKVGWITHHYYPLGCGHGMNPAQLAVTALSPAQTRAEDTTFTQAATVARNNHAQLWIDETNTVGCGGASGFSDSYTTALWAVDYILSGAEHGVSGMNFHGGLSTSCTRYTPLCQTGRNEYAAMPVYYGMLFAHLLGSGNLLPVTVSTTSAAGNIAAFALRPLSGGGLRLIVENLSGQSASAALRLGGHPASASVLHLTGPSLLATSGVRIQGAAVAANGGFTPGKPDTVRCAAGTCPVTISPYTAVLVSVG